jgi:hypothetical protein
MLSVENDDLVDQISAIDAADHGDTSFPRKDVLFNHHSLTSKAFHHDAPLL